MDPLAVFMCIVAGTGVVFAAISAAAVFYDRGEEVRFAHNQSE